MSQENIPITDISDITLSPMGENVGLIYNTKDVENISISDIDFSDCKKREPLSTITNIQKNAKNSNFTNPQKMLMANTLKSQQFETENNEKTQKFENVFEDEVDRISVFQEQSHESSENNSKDQENHDQYKRKLSMRNQEAMKNFSQMVQLKTSQVRNSFKQLIKQESEESETQQKDSQISQQELKDDGSNRKELNNSENKIFLEDYMQQIQESPQNQNNTESKQTLEINYQKENSGQDSVNTDDLLKYNIVEQCTVINENSLENNVKTFKKQQFKFKQQQQQTKQKHKRKETEQIDVSNDINTDDLINEEISFHQQQKNVKRKCKLQKILKYKNKPPKQKKKSHKFQIKKKQKNFKKKKQDFIVVTQNLKKENQSTSPQNLSNISIETDVLLQSLKKSYELVNDCPRNTQQHTEFSGNQSKNGNMENLLTVSTSKIELKNILLTEIRNCSFEIFSKSTKKFMIDLKLISRDLNDSCINCSIQSNGEKQTPLKLNSTCSVMIIPYSFIKVNLSIINQCEKDMHFSGKIAISYNSQNLEIPIEGNYVVPKLEMFSKGESYEKIEKIAVGKFLQVTFANQKQQKSIIIKNSTNIQLTIENKVETGNDGQKDIFFFPKVSNINPNEKINISIFKKSVEHQNKGLLLIGIKKTDIVYPVFLNFQQ